MVPTILPNRTVRPGPRPRLANSVERMQRQRRARSAQFALLDSARAVGIRSRCADMRRAGREQQRRWLRAVRRMRMLTTGDRDEDAAVWTVRPRG